MSSTFCVCSVTTAGFCKGADRVDKTTFWRTWLISELHGHVFCISNCKSGQLLFDSPVYIQDLHQSMQQYDAHELDIVDYPYTGEYEEEEKPELLVPPPKEGEDAEKSRLPVWLYILTCHLLFMHWLTPCVVRADGLDLICGPCLEQLSHERYWNSCGTCKTDHHIKVWTVQSTLHSLKHGLHTTVQCNFYF